MPNATSKRGTTDPQSAVTPARTCALVGSLALGLLMVAAAPLQAQTVVISQVSGGGGASGAPYRQDFVELHNVGQAPVVLDGLSLQYAAPSGFQTFGENPITPLAGT